MSRKRAYHTLTDETHERIEGLHTIGLSDTQIAAITHESRTTIHSIVKLFDESGQIRKKHKGGNHNPVHSDQVKQLITQLQEADNTLRLIDIQHSLDLITLDSPPSLATICRVLHAAGFTTKTLELQAAPRNTLIMKQRRKDWCETVGKNLNPNTAIFIDETPFSFCITRGRGRSVKGTRAITTTPQIRGKNHTVIAAISPVSGLLYYEIKLTEPDTAFLTRRKGSKKKKTAPKGVTRDTFRTFLINLFTKLPQSSSTPFTFIFDNARIHLGDIEELIFQAGYQQQLLPAWSPALNPIEYSFSKWKLAFRTKHVESEAQVDEAINETAKSITSTDCMSWFKHTQSLYAKCAALEDI